LQAIQQHLRENRTAVYDADLAGYFDSIPQDKLRACVRMRVVDGTVLGLIKQWLRASVVEPARADQPPTVRRNDRGTPQGGVLSPWLAKVYLHWFDHLFQRRDGPAHWAKAKLVRYADDFVVLARYSSPRLRDWMEGKLEGWLGWQINRDKTRRVNLQPPGQSLDFLGYTFRYDRDRYGRPQRYWNLEPSRKAMDREREAVRQKINSHQSHTPLPELIERLNRHLRGWSNYFELGFPRQAFRHLNQFVRQRLGQHLQRRSQRGWRARQGVSLYAHLEHLGLVAL
jgi:RNA-directed DNA polymerase